MIAIINYEGFLGSRFSTQFPLIASDPQLHHDHYYAFIPEREGFSIPYKGEKSKHSSSKINCRVDSRILGKGYTNTSASALSGHTNLVNWRAIFKKEKNAGWEIKLGDGTSREYSERVDFISLSQSNSFTKTIHLLKKETKPNGCQVFFDYVVAKNAGRYPKNIKTCNHKGKELNHIRIQYENTGCIVRGFRNNQLIDQLVVYNQSTDKWLLKTKEDKSEHTHTVLTSVVPRYGIATKYHYGKDFNNFLRICEVEKDGVALLKIKYDPKHRVESLFEKTNTLDTWVKTYRFEYEKNKTKVFDALDQLTVYRFDDEQRLSSIDFIDKTGKSIRKEKFRWSTVGDQKGWLHGKYLALGDQTYHVKMFDYDERGNLKKETIKGNLTGNSKVSLTLEDLTLHPENIESYTTTYTYFENNLLESITTQEGVKTSYLYEDGTNLIKAKYVEYDGKIQERLFHEYDANHFLVGIIEDDGSKLNSNDLTNITYRRQKVISPVSDSNQLSFGKPQKICEYYVCNSKPILLKTTHLTYDYLGYETTQAINDSQNNVCYTLVTKYNDKHQIASQTNALNETTLYEDDRFGNKIKEIFVDGHREISYAYDLNGNLVRKEEINTKTKDTFEYSYNAIGQLIQETDSFGNKINYEYDRLGRQTVCKKPYIEALDGKKIRPTVTKRYNIFNCIEEEIDENSHKTTSSYTAYGKPLEICYPDGSKERFSYYLNGQLKQKLEADGSSTEYSYDPKGRITVQRTLGPHGFELKKEEYTYKGPFLICKKDPMEVKIFYEYDAAGRKSKEIVENQIIAYEYDDFDRLIKIKRFESATNGQVEIFAYDHLNRITSKELQDFSGTLYGKETSEYDRFGNVAKKVVWNNPQKNASYQSKYHSNGDLKYQIDPLGNKTQFSYNYAHINEFGHKVKCTGIQDPLGQMTVEVQDPLHRVIRVNFHGKGSTDILSSTHYVYSPSGQKLRQEEVDHQGKKYVIEWTYNSQGLVESQTEVSSGKRTFYHYDSMKRLKEKIKPDGTSLYYTYDRYGRIETLTSSDKTIHYVLEYDLNDNPTKIKDLVQNITQKRLYDRLNRLIKEELSEGLSVEYTYDPLNRITQVKLPDSSCIRYEYDAFYLKKILRLKKDGTLAYTYECQERDFQGNLIQAASQTFVVQNKFDLLGRKVQVKSSYFSSDLLSFDPLGNLLALKQSCFFKEKNENFTYDRFSQITSESEHQYTFDSLGNCIQKDGKAQIVNTSNQLIQDETATYKYSDNGSLVFVSNPETFYKYDALERLISSKQKEEKVRYIFDFFGRCLFIKDALGTRQLIYLGLQEIGSIKDCAIDTLRLVNPENSETFAIELQDEVSFPMQDHRHNICALQRMDGTLAQAITYTAFGQEQLFNESEEIINPWRFANRRSTHGLLLFAHRFYNPKLMRWQTQDLLGFEDGPHLYAYVHNNPLTHFDLFGLQDLDLRHLSFWERWQEMDFESFAAKATYSPTTLAAHAWTGVSQGLFEGYMDPIDSASNHFSSDRSSADITEQFRFGGKSLGVVGGTAIALANTANQVVKSGVTYVAKIGTNKVISHTVDKAKSVASERLSIQHLPSQGAESPNAAINLNRKLSRLEKFQQNAVKTRELPDGRVRYYDQETFSQKNGPTRGACNVVEWNPKTGNVRGWYECYDHKGNINRVHPKNINGQLIKSPHYPPTGSEIIR